eukprot:scaffold55439_cov22-Tisochrysis_lutea.AAC.1
MPADGGESIKPLDKGMRPALLGGFTPGREVLQNRQLSEMVVRSAEQCASTQALRRANASEPCAVPMRGRSRHHQQAKKRLWVDVWACAAAGDVPHSSELCPEAKIGALCAAIQHQLGRVGRTWMGQPWTPNLQTSPHV